MIARVLASSLVIACSTRPDQAGLVATSPYGHVSALVAAGPGPGGALKRDVEAPGATLEGGPLPALGGMAGFSIEGVRVEGELRRSSAVLATGADGTAASLRTVRGGIAAGYELLQAPHLRLFPFAGLYQTRLSVTGPAGAPLRDRLRPGEDSLAADIAEGALGAGLDVLIALERLDTPGSHVQVLPTGIGLGLRVAYSVPLGRTDWTAGTESDPESTRPAPGPDVAIAGAMAALTLGLAWGAFSGGACTDACPSRPHATAVMCSSRGCGYRCQPGFTDADGVIENGCEMPVAPPGEP
jgi:hypothetical protein